MKMQVRELIEKLRQFESDTEVYLYVWDGQELKSKSTPLISIEKSRNYEYGIYLLGENWPECMAGGHAEGCMCNLGFTPRWRNRNE